MRHGSSCCAGAGLFERAGSDVDDRGECNLQALDDFAAVCGAGEYESVSIDSDRSCVCYSARIKFGCNAGRDALSDGRSSSEDRCSACILGQLREDCDDIILCNVVSVHNSDGCRTAGCNRCRSVIQSGTDQNSVHGSTCGSTGCKGLKTAADCLSVCTFNIY